MNRKAIALAAVVSLTLQGCFFFVIPGSVTGKISDAVTGAKGANCVSATNKIGDKIRGPDGSIGTIKSLSGTSSRCTDARYPIRAEIVFAPDTATPAAPPSVYVSPVRFDSLVGWDSAPLSDAQSKAGWYAKIRNRNIDAEALLSATTHDGITDMDAYAQTRKTALLTAITDPVPIEQVHQLEINGLHAYRYIVTGKAKNGQLATYVGTIIEGPKDIAVIVTYTFAANYDQQKDALAQISLHVVGFR